MKMKSKPSNMCNGGMASNVMKIMVVNSNENQTIVLMVMKKQ